MNREFGRCLGAMPPDLELTMHAVLMDDEIAGRSGSGSPAQEFNSSAGQVNMNTMKAGKVTSMSKVLLVIIAIVLPPLAVGLKAGIGFHLFLNIILTLLVYLPGVLHAIWVVLKD